MPADSYKPKVLISTLDLPEADWLEYRRRGIGGSDAAAIFGVSPFKTARDLYYDKLKIASFEDDNANWVKRSRASARRSGRKDIPWENGIPCVSDQENVLPSRAFFHAG